MYGEVRSKFMRICDEIYGVVYGGIYGIFVEECMEKLIECM